MRGRGTEKGEGKEGEEGERGRKEGTGREGPTDLSPRPEKFPSYATAHNRFAL